MFFSVHKGLDGDPGQVKLGALALVVVFAVSLLLRCPLGFSMLAVGTALLVLLLGLHQAYSLLAASVYHIVSSWLYVVIPMFILMGELIAVSGVMEGMFNVFRGIFKGFRLALAVVTVLTAVFLSFATGSTLAAIALLSRLSYDEMRKTGYSKEESLATILGGASLANMIPPSIGLPLYAILTNQSIAKMLLAGILPGCLAAMLFLIFLPVYARAQRSAPVVDIDAGRDSLASLHGTAGSVDFAKVGCLVGIILVMIGGMYFGFFSATEASCVGAFAALLLALTFGRLSRKTFYESALRTSALSGLIFLLLVGIGILSRYLAFVGFSRDLTEVVIQKGVSARAFILYMSLVYFILGCLVDPTSMMLLVVPIVFPIVKALEIDPIWFGVFTVAWIQIGQLTPPVGMGCYVLASVTGEDLSLCFKASIPVGVAWVVTVLLLWTFPWIVTWLPGHVV